MGDLGQRGEARRLRPRRSATPAGGSLQPALCSALASSAAATGAARRRHCRCRARLWGNAAPHSPTCCAGLIRELLQAPAAAQRALIERHYTPGCRLTHALVRSAGHACTHAPCRRRQPCQEPASPPAATVQTECRRCRQRTGVKSWASSRRGGASTGAWMWTCRSCVSLLFQCLCHDGSLWRTACRSPSPIPLCCPRRLQCWTAAAPRCGCSWCST